MAEREVQMRLAGGASEAATSAPSGTAPALESLLGRIDGVAGAKVVLHGDRIAEVHLLTNRSRPPKQFVRDVQTALHAGFGIEVDYRAVSVVQMEDPPEEARPATAERPRPAVVRVSTELENDAITVTVRLSGSTSESEGTARGPSTSGPRVAALAALDAVGAPAGGVADIESVDLVATAHRNVALVVVKLLTGRGEHVLTGSAPLRKDATDAVVRATLAALNRVLGPS